MKHYNGWIEETKQSQDIFTKTRKSHEQWIVKPRGTNSSLAVFNSLRYVALYIDISINQMYYRNDKDFRIALANSLATIPLKYFGLEVDSDGSFLINEIRYTTDITQRDYMDFHDSSCMIAKMNKIMSKAVSTENLNSKVIAIAPCFDGFDSYKKWPCYKLATFFRIEEMRKHVSFYILAFHEANNE